MKAKKRGISKEQICVSCMTNQKDYQATIAGYGRITKNQLESLNQEETGATLTEEFAFVEKINVSLSKH